MTKKERRITYIVVIKLKIHRILKKGEDIRKTSYRLTFCNSSPLNFSDQRVGWRNYHGHWVVLQETTNVALDE